MLICGIPWVVKVKHSAHHRVNTSTCLYARACTQHGNKQVEVLQKRDQEMTEFIERFDQTKDEALVDQKSARTTIVGLLEHISQGLDAQHHIPEQSRMRVSKRNKRRCGEEGREEGVVYPANLEVGFLMPSRKHELYQLNFLKVEYVLDPTLKFTCYL